MSVGRHTLYNLAGSVTPMFVSIVTVPIYLHMVGPTRYGVLSIVWLFLGYFGLFDPGLSRAATYHIARLHDAPAKERGDVFWTALVVNTGFGIVGGVVLYLVARPVFLHEFKMPEGMRDEVIACLPWLAASIPVSITAGVLGGALQAREWFGVSNAINVGNAFLTQGTPLAVAYFHGPDLVWLIPAILLARAAGAVPGFLAAARALPLGAGGGFRRSLLRSLFSYGGWITVTNMLVPILNTVDRMVIGSVLSVEDVAFYNVPFNLVTRISVLPGALSNSLFPKFSRQSHSDGGDLSRSSLALLAAAMTPVVVGGSLALPILMRLWLGADFAGHATPIGLIFLIAVWFNGLAFVPYALLQANNRPDLTAKIHLIQVAPFLIILFLGVHYFGLEGAAWAWTLRVALDALLMFLAAGQFRTLVPLLPAVVLVVVAHFFAPTSLLSLRTCLATVLMAITIAWSCSIAPQLKTMSTKTIDKFVSKVVGRLAPPTPKI